MNKYFGSYKAMICCLFVVALGVISCNNTSTPERLQLVDGELDACLLVTSIELETVTGFNVVGDSRPMNPSGTSCTYTKTDGDTFRIFVSTDATLKRYHIIGTAEDWYNLSKAEELKQPKRYIVEDVGGFGSQAYFSNNQGFELAVRVLNNGIFFEFIGFSTSGINRDKLIQIAKIALRRAP